MSVQGKHTPGPWTVACRDTGGVCEENPTRGRPFLIASVYGDDPNCMHDARMDANVCLIVAAPDLLDALDEAYGELQAESHRDGARCLLLTKIEAAIAKAKGGAK